MIKLEKDIEKYMRAVEDYLVCPKEQKEKVLSEIRNSIYVYAEENGIADIKEVYEHFGTPEEIASQHLSAVDPKKIKKALDVKRAIITALAIIVLMVAAMIIIELIDSHKETHGTFEETIVVFEEGIGIEEAKSMVEESMQAELTKEK